MMPSNTIAGNVFTEKIREPYCHGNSRVQLKFEIHSTYNIDSYNKYVDFFLLMLTNVLADILCYTDT